MIVTKYVFLNAQPNPIENVVLNITSDQTDLICQLLQRGPTGRFFLEHFFLLLVGKPYDTKKNGTHC